MTKSLSLNTEDRRPETTEGTIVSVTRFRARSVWVLPVFAFHAHRAIAQLRSADGYIDGAVRRDTHLIFWTMTLWRDDVALAAYVASGAHGRAMPSLRELGSEAAVVRWAQGSGDLPDWATAERRLRAQGRDAVLRHPGPAQGDLSFAGTSMRYAGRL